MPVWYREWEKEHAQLWEAITGQISPKVLTPAPKLIAVFWRWIKAFVLWLSKLERSLPAGLNQHSISPQQRLPAWWTLLPRSRRAWQETECLHTHICILVLWRNAPPCPRPGFCVQHRLYVKCKNKYRPVIFQTAGAITERLVRMKKCVWSGGAADALWTRPSAARPDKSMFMILYARSDWLSVRMEPSCDFHRHLGWQRGRTVYSIWEQ